MEIRELRSLLLLADLGSIVKTADERNLTSPAIHKHLKALEDELGVRLYERAGRNLRLTQAAILLLPHIRKILLEYDAALQSLEELKGIQRGVVRVGAGPTFSSYLLPNLLQQYQGKYPSVEIFVETGHTPQLLDDLSKGAIDLAFIVSSELSEKADFEEKLSWDFEFVLVGSPGQLPRRCALAAARELPFVLYRKGSVMENLIDHYFAGHQFHPRVTMRLDNAEAIKAMIKSKLGVSMLPYWTIAPEIRARSLAPVRTKEPPLLGRLILVGRKSAYLSQPVKAFLEAAENWKFRDARPMKSLADHAAKTLR
jgi:LysR family transcriptional regulator, transcription activator of glutamate synthase operon